MSMTNALLQEFENEAGTTRRVLERVPEDKLSWKPHPKSMSLGVLALHVAASPGVICGWADEGVTQFKGEASPTPSSTDEILAAHDKSVAEARATLQSSDDNRLLTTNWKLRAGGQVVSDAPRHVALRDMLNHLAHHRGQLTVYLRLLGATVPAVYGPSADDQRFA